MAKAISNNPSAKAAYTGPAPCGMYDETTGELMPSRVKALTNIIADYEAEQERVCAKFPTCMTDDVTGLADLAEAVWPYAERALQST